MKVGFFDVGVCSWSLRPADSGELIGKLRRLGLHHLQLALGPLLELDSDARAAQIEALDRAEIKITASMINFVGEDYSKISNIRRTGGLVPDALWPVRRQRAIDAARLSQQIGVRQMSTHVGFIPPSNNDAYGTLVERLSELGEQLGEFGVDLLMETGQESATDLLHFIHDLTVPNVGVSALIARVTSSPMSLLPISSCKPK